MLMNGCSIFLDRQFSQREADFFNQYPVPPQFRHSKDGIKVTFFGTTTLLFDDGKTKIMVDGFFSRPPMHQLLRFQPDKKLIKKVIADQKLKDLAVVVPVHSHHDHAMDAPLIAMLTDAQLLGSSSTFMLGKDMGLPQKKWTPVDINQTYDYGLFTIKLIPAKHGQLPGFLKSCLQEPKEIQNALEYPVHLCRYKEGESYVV